MKLVQLGSTAVSRAVASTELANTASLALLESLSRAGEKEVSTKVDKNY